MRNSNKRVMPHPVWLKPGSTSPRNQKLNTNTSCNTQATASDRARVYVSKMNNPLLSRTVHDILQDIKLAKLKRDLVGG